MEFDSLISKAVDRCLSDAIPFVVFVMPGSDVPRFYASLPDKAFRSPAFVDDTADCFFINFFDNDEPYTAGVRFALTAQDVLGFSDPDYRHDIYSSPRPRISPTRRASYHEAFSAVKPRLKNKGGKVVLSRHRSIFTKLNPLQIAARYFSLTDTTFRYLCFTPETGVWLGSTPELLLESDSKAGSVRTMSLAGTRRADDDTEWDSKNIVEQAIVTDSICGVLRSAGLNVEAGPLGEKRFLDIKHLCTPIVAEGEVCIPELMSALSPTPAVAGYPYEKAIEEINRCETHRRYCYGGYVGVRLNGDYHAYVNLRCVLLAPVHLRNEPGWLGNLYAGGGIVAASREDDEWQETEAKTRALAEIFLGSDGSSGYEGPQMTFSTLQYLPDVLPF